LTDFILKDDDNDNNDDGSQLLQNPAGHMQAGLASYEIDDCDGAEPCQHLYSTAFSEP
jgi:hypothetical protein